MSVNDESDKCFIHKIQVGKRNLDKSFCCIMKMKIITDYLRGKLHFVK